jgi:hypothetical protein
MAVFIENKQIETVERERVINFIERLIDKRYERDGEISGLPESDLIIDEIDMILKNVLDFFPIEFQIAKDKVDENYNFGEKYEVEMSR